MQRANAKVDGWVGTSLPTKKSIFYLYSVFNFYWKYSPHSIAKFATLVVFCFYSYSWVLTHKCIQSKNVVKCCTQ